MSLSQEAMLALLKTYEEAYYSGESKVSDEEYDSLKATYVEMYGEYDFVPNEGEVEHFIKTKHLYPLKSLDKLQISDDEGLRKEITRLWPVVIEDKFDGLSIEIQYVDDKLKFITRGNGEIGDDVTAQCMQIPGVEFLENLFYADNVSYRAEILMTHSDFKRINDKKAEDGEELLSNCRNAAAGMLRNKDLSKVEGLTIMLYEDLSSISKESYNIHSMHDYLDEYIKDTNIRIASIYRPSDVDEAIRYIKELETRRKLIDYDIDGLVVKCNLPDSLKLHGGYTGHHPKNAIAVKGEAKGGWTPIKSITWQVGKEYITPVAELEPIEIDGSIISRATLHNVSFLRAIGLETLCYKNKDDILPLTEVEVIKANDVIPRIINVKSHFEESSYTKILNIPSHCPICGADTAIKETDSDSELLICTGDNCPAKMQKKIEQMCSRDGLNIAGMSEGTIKKLLDYYDIEEAHHILGLQKEHLLELEGFADKSAEKLANAVEEAVKEQPVNKVLYASAIPLIGRSASKDICEHFSIQELMSLINLDNKKEFIKELCKVKDIGVTMAESFYDNKSLFTCLLKCIYRVNDIKSNKAKPVKQLIFCITGQREPFKTIIEETGHKISSSVSKKTDALINANDETSSKSTKAKHLGIPIIKTEQELRDFLKEK